MKNEELKRGRNKKSDDKIKLLTIKFYHVIYKNLDPFGLGH